MKIKDVVQLEKENMPEYQFKFLYHRVLPGFVFVLGGAVVVFILSLVLGLLTDSAILTCIPFVIWSVVTIVLLILFVVYSKKYSKMLLADKQKEFENEYKIIDYDKASKFLEKNKIIIEDKIYIGSYPININETNISFYCKTLSGIYLFKLIVSDKFGRVLSMIDLDKNLCTYFYNKPDLIDNYQLFELFINDKKEFLNYLYRYNDHEKMLKKLLKKGTSYER